MATGPAAGLELMERLAGNPARESYYLLQSVRGDLLEKVGRLEEARTEFEKTASLTRNERERGFLLDRARTCSDRTAE
jgi:predicted RNA polymerase sigma factor